MRKKSAKKKEQKVEQKALPVGRPSKYSLEIAEYICEQIGTTDKGLSTLAKEDAMFPPVSSIMRWLKEHEEFRELYARAKEMQADLLADQIIEISNTPVEGVTKKTTQNQFGTFQEITIGDAIAHRRLQVDARKWKASKLAPQKFGDKIDITTQGEKLPQTVIQWGDKKIAV